MKEGEPIYEEQLSFDEMVLGIREGKFFKGRLNTSRVNIAESTVLVDGLTDDLLVLGLKDQNRALNGDIVCLEILPEASWVRHFKESDPQNVVDKQVALQALEDNDDGINPVEEAEEQGQASKEKITLMQKINSEKERRVTAKVRGVIKPMNKTYGGSILKNKD